MSGSSKYGAANKTAGSYNTAKGEGVNLLKDFGLTQKDIIPTRGNTIADALFSKDEIKNAIHDKIKALGPQRGSMALYDENGDPLINHRFYHHELKKWVTTDNKGRVMWGNQGVVDESYEAHKERERQVDYATDRCCVNNELCAYMLGYSSVAELREYLGAGKGFKFGNEDIDDDLVAVDAMPEKMQVYPAGKEKSLYALKKLRLLVETRLNHINLMDVGGKRSDEHNMRVLTENKTGTAFDIDTGVA